MRTILFSALTAALLAPSTVRADEKSELAKLKGEFKVLSIKQGGKDAPAPVLKSKLLIEGNQFTMVTTRNDMERKSAITAKLDDSKSPKHLDLSKDGKVRFEGIYKLEGKKLTICYNRAGKGRPDKFDSPAETEIMLLVFEKTK